MEGGNGRGEAGWDGVFKEEKGGVLGERRRIG